MIGKSPIRLEVQVSPTEIVPEAVWNGFARAVYEAAHNWGLNVAIGHDGQRSLDGAFRRFWEAQNIAQGDDGGRTQDHT